VGGRGSPAASGKGSSARVERSEPSKHDSPARVERVPSRAGPASPKKGSGLFSQAALGAEPFGLLESVSGRARQQIGTSGLRGPLILDERWLRGDRPESRGLPCLASVERLASGSRGVVGGLETQSDLDARRGGSLEKGRAAPRRAPRHRSTRKPRSGESAPRRASRLRAQAPAAQAAAPVLRGHLAREARAACF